MIISHINIPTADIKQIADFMADPINNLELIEVSQINWPDTFPSKPEVKVRIAHTDNEILLQYEVNEQYTQAKVTCDNGEVWTDSCCEFFIAFDETGYYNLETTCIGKSLLGFRQNKDNATHGNEEVMRSIRRHSTLGTEPFEERIGDNHWRLTIALPVSAFFAHHIQSLSGKEARINVYKCGDNLSKPHFVSLFPIQYPQPNFHLPEFFQSVKFA